MRDASEVRRKGMHRYCVVAMLLATTGPRLAAQTRPSYDAASMACVAYHVLVTTDLTTELQGRLRVEQLRREGRLSLRGTPGDGGIMIEAWWDSLALLRRADGQTLTPDADGILGGRYLGTLKPDGTFLRTTAPWVPDEVAEVSDLAVALDDLFPVFSVGTIRAIGDSAGMRRYRLRTSNEVDGPPTPDRAFAVRESETSDGVVAWGRAGLVSWGRSVTAETKVREDPSRAFRSRVEQRIELRRVGACSGS